MYFTRYESCQQNTTSAFTFRFTEPALSVRADWNAYTYCRRRCFFQTSFSRVPTRFARACCLPIADSTVGTNYACQSAVTRRVFKDWWLNWLLTCVALLYGDWRLAGHWAGVLVDGCGCEHVNNAARKLSLTQWEEPSDNRSCYQKWDSRGSNPATVTTIL